MMGLRINLYNNWQLIKWCFKYHINPLSGVQKVCDKTTFKQRIELIDAIICDEDGKKYLRRLLCYKEFPNWGR